MQTTLSFLLGGIGPLGTAEIIILAILFLFVAAVVAGTVGLVIYLNKKKKK